jgi:hypothetical protein
MIVVIVFLNCQSLAVPIAATHILLLVPSQRPQIEQPEQAKKYVTPYWSALTHHIYLYY